MARSRTPEAIPVLSRGKHRNPRKGACFMEYASMLAGERWSDHPDCTHPLLAGVARTVNDHISDEARSGLVGMIPSVIGLSGDDPSVDVGIAMRCAATALPFVAEYRQRALAVGVITARRVLVELEEPTPTSRDNGLFDHASNALSGVPRARQWAEEFTAGHDVSLKAFRRRSASNIVSVAVVGIAEAAIADSDTVLHQLLDTVITDCEKWLGPAVSVGSAQPELSRATD